MHKLRFNVVTGKGGVGKTLVSILNGVRAARSGKRTLICELNTAEAIPPLLNTKVSNGNVVSVTKNLSVVNIRPNEALMEYANLKLGLSSLSRLIFDNPLVRTLTDFVPGMSDLLMLGKAFNHERERASNGEPLWDLIIVDAPATGHGLTFLNLPSVISNAIPSGNMHDEAVLMHALLKDPERTRIDLVTTPEPLPIQETIELATRLHEELKLPLGQIYVNRCIFDNLSAPIRKAVMDMADSGNQTLRWLQQEFAYTSSVKDALLQLQPLNLPICQLPEIQSLKKGPISSDDLDMFVERLTQ